MAKIPAQRSISPKAAGAAEERPEVAQEGPVPRKAADMVIVGRNRTRLIITGR